MRIWAFIAAAGLCIGQAEAQTFVRYHVTGSGTVTLTNSAGIPTPASYMSPFFLDFSILATPGSSFVNSEAFVSDGNVFQANGPNPVNVTANGASSGSLTYSEVPFGSTLPLLNVSVSYADTDSVGGFPTAFASSAATGTVQYQTTGLRGGGGTGGYSLSGAIATIAIERTSAAFDDFVISLPEPASWLSMIAGAGLIGAAMRRRRAVTRLA